MSAMQHVYRVIFDWCGGSPLLLDLSGWLLILMGWYWILSGLFLFIDITGKPAALLKYKVQPNTQVDMTKLWRAVKVVFRNTIVLSLLFFYPMHLSSLAAGIRFSPDDLPSVLEMVKDVVISALVQEAVFYYSHRIFHHPWVYKRIHKQHHEWTAPIGLIATYSSVAEYTTGNGMSVFLGPLVARSHITTVWLWYFVGVTVTIVHHSGYHLPLLPSPEFHDYHHAKFQGNYGTLGLLDWLHGTDRDFRKSIEGKRHHTLLGLTPVRQSIRQSVKAD